MTLFENPMPQGLVREWFERSNPEVVRVVLHITSSRLPVDLNKDPEPPT